MGIEVEGGGRRDATWKETQKHSKLRKITFFFMIYLHKLKCTQFATE